MELETHLLLCARLSYLPGNEVESLLGKTGEVSRMLSGLIRSLKQSRAAVGRT